MYINNEAEFSLISEQTTAIINDVDNNNNNKHSNYNNSDYNQSSSTANKLSFREEVEENQPTSMGCLSSRSSVAPANNSTTTNSSKNNITKANGTSTTRQMNMTPAKNGSKELARNPISQNSSSDSVSKDHVESKGSGSEQELLAPDRKSAEQNPLSKTRFEPARQEIGSGKEAGSILTSFQNGAASLEGPAAPSNKDLEREGDTITMKRVGNKSDKANNNNNSFDDEANLELYKQYVAVDYEISQLEDRDTLRVYHEKIEQLEQLERELDMITSEAEEVAARNELEPQSESRLQSPGPNGNGPAANGAANMDALNNGENNSMLSGVTGSISHKSWTVAENNNNNNNQANTADNNKGASVNNITGGGKGLNNALVASGRMNTSSSLVQGKIKSSNGNGDGLSSDEQSRMRSGKNLLGYSTVEEVFNRKIILEKERDKLKKEVELIIIECDRLQQRYKKRDEILDKLFDGRAGNGLENHLEQQLNWLMEQKHYVDQVFYAWKRAETLTSQTCEQFASALELLKRLPKVQSNEKREEVAKTIGELLIKSRQDMEQAQRYNPNVDAPFFTDNETERFDKIIETISTNPISPSEFSQIMTSIQFAYKRAVSIRLWLEQILQTTIARDSFELAEEYKWIAIQLRKERINIVKAKLQEQPLASIAESILEDITRQEIMSARRRQQQELNRDSGVESEANEVEIEEEIYRLLELNKFRLQSPQQPEGAAHPGGQQPSGLAASSDDQPKVMEGEVNGASQGSKEQLIKSRIDQRMERSIAGAPEDGTAVSAASSLGFPGTPSKLRVELDEETRRKWLAEVGEMHNKHKSRIESLRGSSKAKASSFIANKKMARQKQQQLAQLK